MLERHHPLAGFVAVAGAAAAAGHSVAGVHHAIALTVAGPPTFGFSAAGPGDLDGDGICDLILGIPHDASVLPFRGSARVVSGRTGEQILVLHGATAGEQFGYAVAGAGDVDDDGVPDLIVGSPFADLAHNNSGAARVFSGADGGLLHTFSGRSVNAQLGLSVAGAGDVDRDGHDDLVVGAFGENANGPFSGSARVYSGRTGAMLHEWAGGRAGDLFGYAVASAGDVDGDDHPDIAVGAPGQFTANRPTGAVHVFSGRTGARLILHAGAAPGAFHGGAVAPAGDVNLDGFDDVLAGAPNDFAPNGAPAGAARVISGADGTTLLVLHARAAGAQFGHAVAGLGDVSGDGVPDLAVGAPGDRIGGLALGSIRVFSGASGSEQWIGTGQAPGDQYGIAVAALVDANADGMPDFAAGAAAGSYAQVFLSDPDFCDTADFAEPPGTLDLADLVAFLSALLAQEPAADLNNDGSFDLADVGAFLDVFGSGCVSPE